MEVTITTRYANGTMLVDINIEGMNAASVSRLNVDEIKSMIEPQAKFLLMHHSNTCSEREAATLSHAVVHGPERQAPADGKADADRGDSSELIPDKDA